MTVYRLSLEQTLRALAVFLYLAALGCQGNKAAIDGTVGDQMLTETQLSRLASQRVFFGHKSVGTNILDGIRERMITEPRLNIRIVNLTDPSSGGAAGLVELELGENGSPESKNLAFSNALATGVAVGGGIVMFKYCYVDISGSTDVQEMFRKYRQMMDGLKLKYPDLKFVHITVPLTTVESAPKAALKSLLRRPTERAANTRRNQFNELLRNTYSKEPIFDLAAIESTHSNGRRCYFRAAGKPIYSLAPEYTSDGGHLNAMGRQAAGNELLRVLASL